MHSPEKKIVIAQLKITKKISMNRWIAAVSLLCAAFSMLFRGQATLLLMAEHPDNAVDSANIVWVFRAGTS